MFARTVTINLKANSSAEFTRTLENQIIPLLRKQKGFQDEVTLLALRGTEAVAISFWDRIENAEAYAREVYPEVLKALAKLVEGTPKVESHEVSNSTFHKIAAHAAACDRGIFLLRQSGAAKSPQRLALEQQISRHRRAFNCLRES